MSYSETVNEKTVDVMKSEFKAVEKRGDRKEVRSKDETYTTRDKKETKLDYNKKAEVKKKESDRKANDQEKKEKNEKRERSRERKGQEEKKYDEKNLAVSKKHDSKQRAQDAKNKERKPAEGHRDRANDCKQTDRRRTERKVDEKKPPANSEEPKQRNEKGQTMQVSCVTKALESINVNPVALLVSKMIDQQSLVVKLLTEAREKEARKLDFMDRGEKSDEIFRMKEKVRLLEKQLKSLEMTLEQKVDKYDRFDSIRKTESTQTQQYGIDNATNTGANAEATEARDVGIRITNAARQRHTCIIF